MRVNDRHSVRQRFARLVVVGNDNIHPERFCKLGFFNGGNARVDGDNQFHAIVLELLNCRFRHAVTFRNAVGNIALHVGALLREIEIQKRRRGDTVRVVIAEHGNFLKIFNRLPDALDRFFHIGEQKRVGKFSFIRQK